MKVLQFLTGACLLATNTPVFAHPQPVTDIQVAAREAVADVTVYEGNDLFKRKGGGGGGGKGGGGSSSGGSSSGKGGGSSGSSSSGGSSSSSSSRGGSTSNTGGATRTGSGPQPGYGGGRYYGGGATQPYAAGRKSPLGVTPFLLGGAALAFLPAFWLAGAFAYPYHNPYTFHNRTARRNQTTTPTRDVDFAKLFSRQSDDGVNETKPVTCLCLEYQPCGCDDNGNTTFLDSIIGDGTYANLNQTLVTVADVNGTSTIVLNGTLPNGTTVSGGTDEVGSSDGSDGSTSSSTGSTSAAVRNIAEAGGYWAMIAVVGLTCFAI